jgi:hypothetical protein
MSEEFKDEGFLDVDKILEMSDDLLSQADALDAQAVEGIKEMIRGGLKLTDSLAEGTLVDDAFDVD